MAPSNYAFPRFAGMKFRGSNIGPPAAHPAVTSYYDSQFDWMTGVSGGWDHYKNSIDLAATIGLNALRLMFEPTLFYGGSRGTVTTLQLTNALDQMITYMAAQGIAFYPCLCNAYNIGSLTLSGIQTIITTMAIIVTDQKYHNVIGVDLFNEANVNSATAWDNLAAIVTNFKTSRLTAVPVSSSITGATNVLDPSSNAAIDHAIAAGVEFLDLHNYYDQDVDEVAKTLANSGNLPVVFGEGGVTWNGGPFGTSGAAQESTRLYSSEKRADFLQMLAAFGKRFDIQMFLQWDLTPQDSSDDGNDYGLGDLSFTPRSAECAIINTIPKTIQARQQTHTIDLSLFDTTPNTANGTCFEIGSRQRDTSSNGRFYRNGNRIKVSDTDGFGFVSNGLINTALAKAIDQSYSMRLLFSQSSPDGTGVMSGGPMLRINAGRTAAYVVTLVSYPGNLTYDGLVSATAFQSGTATTVCSAIAVQPLDVTHDYTLTATATGINPTTITVTVHDDTANTTLTGCSGTDSTAVLQAAGQVGFTPNHGSPLYVDTVTITMTPDPGPTMSVAPTCASPDATVLALTWTPAEGGVGTKTYTPQYVTRDADGWPAAFSWSNGMSTTSPSGGLFGLTPSEQYLVRNKVVDDAGVTNYSNWLSVNTTAVEATSGHFVTMFAGAIR